MFIALVLGAAVGVVWILPMPFYSDVAVEPPTISGSDAELARGRKLVTAACGGCHGAPDDPRLRGRAMTELPSRWGKLTAPNLTRHKSAGLGAVGDAELARALRCGIARDGGFMPPYMPRYDRIADDDLAAILAFLRSEDPLVASSSSRPGESSPSIWIKLQSQLVWRPKPAPAQAIAAPSPGDADALGKYLVEDLLQCNACHGSGLDALALDDPRQDPNFLGGGMLLSDVNGKKIYAANLTFDEDTGIGAWSFDEFRRAMTEGRRADGSLLRWPMRRYPMLDEAELAAIYAYLSNVPPVVGERLAVDPYPIPGQRLDRGRHLFFKQECYTCHGDKAPHGALIEAAQHFETDAAMAEFLRDPSVTKPGTQMPAYGGVLEDADLLALAAYVRSVAPAQPPK